MGTNDYLFGFVGIHAWKRRICLPWIKLKLVILSNVVTLILQNIYVDNVKYNFFFMHKTSLKNFFWILSLDLSLGCKCSIFQIKRKFLGKTWFISMMEHFLIFYSSNSFGWEYVNDNSKLVNWKRELMMLSSTTRAGEGEWKVKWSWRKLHNK